MIEGVGRGFDRGVRLLANASPWLYLMAMLVYYASLHVTVAWQVIALQTVVLLAALLSAAGLRNGLSYLIVAIAALNVVDVVLVARAYPQWDWTFFDPRPPGILGLAMSYMLLQAPLTLLVIFAALLVPAIRQWKASSRRT